MKSFFQGQSVETVLAEAKNAIAQFNLLPEEEHERTDGALLQAAAAVQQKMLDINARIGQLEQQMEYEWSDMQEVAYTLRAVLVHDGSAIRGHYLAFTCDDDGNWLRFNDIDVQRVTEEEVFRDSMGGAGSSKMAYCLIYTAFDSDPAAEAITLPPSLEETVTADNIRFTEERAKWDVSHRG